MSDQRVYGPDSEASYFQDVALSAVRTPMSGGAVQRLNRYAAELDAVMREDPKSTEARHAIRCAAEHRRREGDSEVRAATSTTTAGFTTPVYLTEDWAAYRAPDKSFTDQTTNLPLPEYGLQVNVPSFSSAPTTAQQNAENSGASETDPSGTNIQVALTTQTGQITISQQLADRGGLTGTSFDQIVIKQLMSQLDASVDSYVLTQALANAGSVSDATFSMANFYADLAKARELLSDTAGTRLLATHLFSTSDLFGYITRQLDTTNLRPILTPDSGAIVLAAQMNDPKWNSWLGVHMGQLRWHSDDNIAASGANTQIIVARPQEIFTFDGQETSFAYPETNAANLSVVIGLRSYVGAVVRFPKAIAVISGNAYPTTLV